MPAYGQVDFHIIDVSVGTSETTVPHGMDRTPIDAFILRQNTNGNVYRGTTAWDGTNIYLIASATTGVRLGII